MTTERLKMLRYIKSINISLLGLFLILTLTTIFIWLFGTNLTLGFTDNAYHLAVAQGFTRAGGITTWDFWNSLPLGRPQNYPPLFHLIFADLLKIGFCPEIALKLMMELFVTGGLAFFALGIKKIYNIRVAFLSVLILAISVQFIGASATIMPSAMVLFLCPLLFYFLKEKKWINYTVILTLMFYLHLFLPFLILFALTLYIILFERKMFLSGLKASLVALVLYSPWLIHILLNGVNSIKYFDSSYQISRYQTSPQINLIFIGLALTSLLFLIIKKKLIKNDYFFLVLLTLFIILAFFATGRTLYGHLWIFIALFTALFLDRYLNKIDFLPYLTFVIFIFTIFSMPYLFFNENIHLNFDQPTVAKIISGSTFSKISKEDRFQKLFSEIKNNSKEGESIGTALVDFDGITLDKGEYQSSVAIYMAANTSRPTINLYQPEYFYRPLPDLSKARLVLLNEKAENLTPLYFNDFGYSSPKDVEITELIKNNFIQIDDDLQINSNSIKNIYLYKNKNNDVIKETVSGFVIPFWLANTLLGLMVGLIIFNARKNKIRKF